MVIIEKRRVVWCNKIADEINKGIKKAKQLNEKIYLSLLKKDDITIEEKKKALMEKFHNLIVNTFTNKKSIKNNLDLLRKIIIKLRDINYYLQAVFLEEIGLKPKRTGLIKEETAAIDKKELDALEYSAYKLIEKIVFIDNALLKDYERKEEKITEEKETETKDLEGLLKKESELLCHLEAKIPPKSKFDERLLKKENFGHWVARVLALLAALGHAYEKEMEIFKKLKQNQRIKKKLAMKIKHILNEKKGLLKVREEKILAAEKLSKMEAIWQKIFHEWAITSRL